MTNHGIACTPEEVTDARKRRWKERLEDKVDGLRSIDEYMMARQCWDSGLSVHMTQKAIEDRRRGIAQ